MTTMSRGRDPRARDRRGLGEPDVLGSARHGAQRRSRGAVDLGGRRRRADRLGLGRRDFAPVLVPVGPGLLRRAVTGRCELKRALVGLAAKEERWGGPVAGLEGGDGRKIEQTVTIQRPARRAVPLLAAVRQPAALHGQSRVGHRAGRSALPLGGQGTAGHAGRMGRRDPQRDRGRADRLALAAGRRRRSGRLGALLAGAGGQTEVRVVMRYAAPAGRVGDAIAHILGR